MTFEVAYFGKWAVNAWDIKQIELVDGVVTITTDRRTYERENGEDLKLASNEFKATYGDLSFRDIVNQIRIQLVGCDVQHLYMVASEVDQYALFFNKNELKAAELIPALSAIRLHTITSDMHVTTNVINYKTSWTDEDGTFKLDKMTKGDEYDNIDSALFCLDFVNIDKQRNQMRFEQEMCKIVGVDKNE